MWRVLVSIFVVSFLVIEGESATITWQTCPGNRKLRLDEISLAPLPLQFPSVVRARVRGEVLGHVRGHLKVKTKLYARINFGLFKSWVKFPICIRDFGSCTFENACDMIIPDCGLTRCACPLIPETFITNVDNIELPRLPEFVQWATRRDYKTEIKSYEDGRLIQCHIVYIHL